MNGAGFYAECVMERIRALFDPVFMMCHLIGCIFPCHALLVPPIIVHGARNRRKKVGG